jgi:hypothetical protein
MKTIKKFEPLSVMRIAGICYAALGLVEGAFISVIFLVAPFAPTPGRGAAFPHWMGLLFGGLSIVFFPIFLGLFGALMAGLGAVIYNVSARYFGAFKSRSSKTVLGDTYRPSQKPQCTITFAVALITT